MKRRVNVRGIIMNDRGEMFCQKLTSSKADFWCTPGGGLDPLESLHDGLHREMVEETGVEPKIGRLLYVQQFNDEDKEGQPVELLEFFFHITNWQNYENIDLSSTSHGVDEVKQYGFISPKESTILPKFLQDFTLDDLDRGVRFYFELKN